MERGNRRGRWPPSWKSLKRRLGWKRIAGFCGTSKWVFETDAGEQPLMLFSGVDQSAAGFETVNPPQAGTCIIGQVPATMNLATALAADRWQISVGPAMDGIKIKPLKSLVRLFEGMDGGDVTAEDDGGEIGRMCCLCMERNKGAALIPCGHTYCKVCSRAMWSKQGTCPLCDRSITEILEIF